MAADSKNDNPVETEGAVLPRETWERLTGLLEVFEEALQEASQLSRLPGDDAHRDAALKSLEAVIDLIRLLYPGNQQNLVGPLLETYEALLGVQKGSSPHSLLIRKRKHEDGSPTTRPEIERLQGEAAAAMELLMRTGDGKDEAARKVARRIRAFDLASLGYTRKSRTGITQATIKGWRDRFSGFADSSLGAMRFKDVLSMVENRDPKDAANWVLNSLLGSKLPENRENPPL